MSNDKTLRHILILDDDSDYRNLLVRYLGDMFPDVELTEYDPVSRGAPEAGFDWSRYDVMLLDYNLSLNGVTGLDILKTHAAGPSFPATVMLTGAGNEDVAVRAMKSGIHDYLRKQSLEKDQLRDSIKHAFEEHKAAVRRRDAMAEIREVASKAAEKSFYEYKARYESLYDVEIKRLREEQLKLKEDLIRNNQLLNEVEIANHDAVQALSKAELELTESGQGCLEGDKAELESVNEKVEQLNKGVKETTQKQVRIQGEIEKNLWRQEQEQLKLDQIEEDLKLFNEEFNTEQEKFSSTLTNRDFSDRRKEINLAREAETRKRTEDLFSDVTGQLGKEENK